MSHKTVNHASRVLVLGGTLSARKIAEAVASQGCDVIYSLAGVTHHPELPDVELHVGGFGGAEGLAKYLQAEGVSVVIDATHPFATLISANAVRAASVCSLPLIRFERPPWQKQPGDEWIECHDMSAASSCLPSGSHAFLTIGRRNLEYFTNRRDLSGVIRMIEPPALPLPANWSLQLARPPFSLEEEMSFFARIKATHLVTKNAGGEEGRAKLDAARRFRIPVIMIARPTKTAGLCVADLSAFNDLPSLIKSAGK